MKASEGSGDFTRASLLTVEAPTEAMEAMQAYMEASMEVDGSGGSIQRLSDLKLR